MSLDQSSTHSKILVIMEPPDVRELVMFNLEAKLKIDLVEAKSEAEAIGHLYSETNFGLIIIDGDHEWPEFINAAKEVYKSNTSTKPSPEFLKITLSDSSSKINLSDFHILETVPKKKLLERLPIILQEFFEKNPNSISHHSETGSGDPQYCRIRTQLLLKASPLKSDIHIRLSSKKYLKLFLKGETFDTDDLEKYLINKKVSFLYLPIEETGEFISKFEQDLKLMIDSETITPVQTKSAAMQAIETIQEISIKVGFTPELQELVKTNAKLMTKLVSGNSKIKNLLADFNTNKEQYIASHSIAVAELSCAIASGLEWNSEGTYQKLTMAAMLHDILIINQALAAVTSVSALDKLKNNFSMEEYKIYRDHPVTVSTMVKGFKEMPADVDQIILQHHELPDGKGFPRELTAPRISPISTIFIVAHEIIDEIMNNKTEFNLKKFLADNEKRYATANFKKVYKSLIAKAEAD